MRSLMIWVAVVALGLLSPAVAFAGTGDAQTAWRLLDYVAVDYGGAVADGSVKSGSEYAEMKEFAADVTAHLRALPVTPARAALVQRASNLQDVIAHKSSPQEVAALAHRLAVDLLAAYPVPLAPARPPDFATGTRLFAQNCASCHGVSGDGHGIYAAKLATPPIAFTDVERARQRSVFGLYQVISQGIDGTAMPSFANLPGDQRWALAFRAGSFALSDVQAAKGEKLWKSDPRLRAQIPDLKTLAGLTSVQLAGSIGPTRSDAVLAYLRRHPDQVMKENPSALALARSDLALSAAAFQRGDLPLAKELALSAYLDGFEPVEPTLAARDAALMSRIERAMGEYRAAVQNGSSNDAINNRVAALGRLLDDADAALAPNVATRGSTFLGAFTILLREGMEALLIVVAMLAFLHKAERFDAVRYVHGGWVTALVAGGITWAVATYAIGISGASRELTEGFGSLLAAIVLLSVGIWMHGKAQADQWQRYIREKMSRALSRGSAWFLFGLAFVVVYREVFETILFYAALSTQGNEGTLFGGAGAAIALLGVIAFAMLRYSRSLPITQFFRYSSWLMAGLTIGLSGKGVAALQEAGILDIYPVDGAPQLAILGVYPTWQSILVQLFVGATIAVGFGRNRRKHASAECVG
ncbi:cytochrome c/FTR1 family iron permease [Sphingomonas sp. RB3P16]|uniref:cytochrome c/FTR1 family iron permease n=1 Tax=Parasphingomonas frigoris TaxID=3096163 RepID=UPI002FCA9289